MNDDDPGSGKGNDWQTTETFITSTNQTLTLPTSAWA